MKAVMTIKELNEELDLRMKNKVLHEVSAAVDYLEAIGADENVLLSGSNINCNEIVSNSKENIPMYYVLVEENGVWLQVFTNSELAGVESFLCNPDDKRELLAKAAILNLILKALENNGIKGIEQIMLADALNENNMTNFEKRIEELASRLLIPQKEFTTEPAKAIYRVVSNEEEHYKQLINIRLAKELFLEKLCQAYGVSKKIAKIRLSIANFTGAYTINDHKQNRALNNFKSNYYYDDSEDVPCKTMKKNGD